MKKFADSVQHITGQELEVKPPSDSTSINVVEEELEALRSQVEELSEEVRSSYHMAGFLLLMVHITRERSCAMNSTNKSLSFKHSNPFL